VLLGVPAAVRGRGREAALAGLWRAYDWGGSRGHGGVHASFEDGGIHASSWHGGVHAAFELYRRYKYGPEERKYFRDRARRLAAREMVAVFWLLRGRARGGDA
jgi:hypothetical protein